MAMSRVDSGQFMDGLVKRKDIGGVLEGYIAKTQIRHYIKDGVLNRYTKDKARDAYKLNLDVIVKKEFGFDVSKSDNGDGVVLYRSQQCILIADEDFRVGEPTQAEGVDIGSMTEAAGAAQPAGSLQVR